MNTLAFRTQTFFEKRSNPHTDGFWECAIDVGYSGVKCFSPNSVSVFPSFATPVTGTILKIDGNADKPDEQDIYYKEPSGQIWRVGKCAQDSISASDPNTASLSIYGRSRYFAPMYKVLSDTALGVSMMDNEFGSPKIKDENGDMKYARVMVQTGLPNSFLKSDKEYIKEVFAGDHSFALKIGSGDWVQFSFTIRETDVSVVPQPLGTLMSISTDNNGDRVPETDKYFKSKMIIVDPGFGTMDCFPIENKEMGNMETFDNLGMKAVMQKFTDKIFEEHGVEIPVPAIQKVLETGEVQKYNRKTKQGEMVEVSALLEEANKEVAEAAIEKLREVYDDLIEYNYLVVTGGAGAAWEKYIEESFSGLPNLEVIKGSQNDVLSPIFANVRGYYMILSNNIHKYNPLSV